GRSWPGGGMGRLSATTAADVSPCAQHIPARNFSDCPTNERAWSPSNAISQNRERAVLPPHLRGERWGWGARSPEFDHCPLPVPPPQAGKRASEPHVGHRRPQAPGPTSKEPPFPWLGTSIAKSLAGIRRRGA